MFFGLTNSPSTFSAFMNDIFKDLIVEGKITVYLDDILIFSSDVMTALPAPYCPPFSLFYVFHSRALSHALARASPY